MEKRRRLKTLDRKIAVTVCTRDDLRCYILDQIKLESVKFYHGIVSDLKASAALKREAASKLKSIR